MVFTVIGSSGFSVKNANSEDKVLDCSICHSERNLESPVCRPEILALQ